MTLRLKRMWINAPSALQGDHEYHGTLVLVGEDDYNSRKLYLTAYLTSGPVVSMRVERLTLAEGWPSWATQRSDK